jgi:outer membrane scaffolding protein for murein synthesis (MipA/OmpV family)
LELPLRTVLELGGGLNIRGTVFEPKVSLDTRDLGNGWRLSVATSMVFADNRLSDYFYGVSEHQATILRPSFKAKAGLLSTRLMLDAATNVTKDVRIFGVVRYESYSGSANSESPLMRQSNGVSAGVVVAWILGRSSNLAE